MRALIFLAVLLVANVAITYGFTDVAQAQPANLMTDHEIEANQDRLDAEESARHKEDDRIARIQRAAQIAYDAEQKVQAQREYTRAHTGILGVVNAIRATVRPIGDWISEYTDSWWSQYINTAVFLLVFAYVACFKAPSQWFKREFFGRIITAMVVFLVGAELWAGQFGIEGLASKGWQPDKALPLWPVEVLTVLATLIPTGVWTWVKFRSRRVLAAIGIGVVTAMTAVWIWPETTLDAVLFVIVAPLFIAVFLFITMHRAYGPGWTVGLLSGGQQPPKAQVPARGPQTPTERRSIR